MCTHSCWKLSRSTGALCSPQIFFSSNKISQGTHCSWAIHEKETIRSDLDQSKKKRCLQNQNSFSVQFTLWPHKQLYLYNLLEALLGAQVANTFVTTPLEVLLGLVFWPWHYFKHSLSPKAMPSLLLLFEASYRETIEEIKVSNPNEFADPVQTALLLTIMENREDIWGVRESSSLTRWRCLPVWAMGKGLPGFPSPGHSLHCCTFSGSLGSGDPCFSSWSSSLCSIWLSFLEAYLWGNQ